MPCRNVRHTGTGSATLFRLHRALADYLTTRPPTGTSLLHPPPHTDPATGKEIGEVPELGVSETREAIAAAQRAFKSWGRTTAKERYGYMMKLFSLMNDNAHDLAQICTLENGKPLADAKGEVTYSASFVEWFAGEAVRDTGDVIPHPMSNIRSVVIKQPIGVCGIIT